MELGLNLGNLPLPNLNLCSESTTHASFKVDNHNFRQFMHELTDGNGNSDVNAKLFKKMTLHKNFVVHN